MNKVLKVSQKLKQGLKYCPVPRGFYAFNVERAGDFLIFVESLKDCYKFLYVPGADPFYLSIEDFHNALNSGVLSLVEQLPEDIYEESLLLSCPQK